jgi:hypothetical protein
MNAHIAQSRVYCPHCRCHGAARRQHKPFGRPLFEDLSAGFVWVDRGGPADPYIACARCGHRSREDEPVTDVERAA